MYQLRFPQGKSIATALIQPLEYIIDKLEEGCIVTSLFLDFRKAFNCLKQLASLQTNTPCITRKETKWFSNYKLTKRQKGT